MLLVNLLRVFTLVYNRVLSNTLSTRLSRCSSVAANRVDRTLRCLGVKELPTLIILYLLTNFFNLVNVLLRRTYVVI